MGWTSSLKETQARRAVRLLDSILCSREKRRVALPKSGPETPRQRRFVQVPFIYIDGFGHTCGGVPEFYPTNN